MKLCLRFARALLVGSVAFALAACSASDGNDEDEEDVGEDQAALTPLVPEKVDAISQTPWSTLGLGVSYKSLASNSAVGAKNALLVYGGYSAADVYVQRWADELFREKGVELGIAHLYAVRGPNQSGYANREIANSKIALHLATANRAANAASIVIVAHSSGTYVVDELLSMMRNGTNGVPSSTIGKVALFYLDGGGVANATTLQLLARAYFVYGCDATINRCSKNSGSMKWLGGQYSSEGGAVLVNANGSHCSKTSSSGLWCLHDTLITNRPHNPNMYDLRNDYTDFTNGREVVTSYLDELNDPL